VTPLLIIGASGRAAARSMIRRGFTPTVIDLFADVDTRRMATTLKCGDYPHGFSALAQQVPPMAWVYTGGLENHPDIVDAISHRHHLIGNSGAVLCSGLRDPIELCKTLPALGFHYPCCLKRLPKDFSYCLPSLALQGGAGEGSFFESGTSRLWLRKPYRSAGGFGLSFISEPSPHHYFQQYIKGLPISAVYEDDHLIGTTTQLCGEPWLHTREFQYCGNLVMDDSPHAAEFERVGRALAQHFDLRGDWGIDAIAAESGLCILEINPRYCASRELFDHEMPRGKAIYYAPHRFAFPEGDWTGFADIPAAGTILEAGEPVLTLYGGDLLELKSTATKLDYLFGFGP